MGRQPSPTSDSGGRSQGLRVLWQLASNEEHAPAACQHGERVMATALVRRHPGTAFPSTWGDSRPCPGALCPGALEPWIPEYLGVPHVPVCPRPRPTSHVDAPPLLDRTERTPDQTRPDQVSARTAPQLTLPRTCPVGRRVVASRLNRRPRKDGMGTGWRWMRSDATRCDTMREHVRVLFAHLSFFINKYNTGNSWHSFMDRTCPRLSPWKPCPRRCAS